MAQDPLPVRGLHEFLICALTEFDGLCGFRRPEEAADLLEALRVRALDGYVGTLRTAPPEQALRTVLTEVLGARKPFMAEVVDKAAAAARRLGSVPGPFQEACARYAWIARHHPGDAGVLAAMLLNHVRLRPGEALHLGAGVPHAYLRGTGVEIMANSDNVLRCGLTTKHVDVPELLRVVDFRAAEPAVLTPAATDDGEERYPVLAGEFALSRYRISGDTAPSLPPSGRPQILLCTVGEAVVTEAGGGSLTLGRGQSVYLPATSGECRLTGSDAEVFRATTGLSAAY
ncbi:class I mannose-6-phosphate isomerase [Streptomyces sp. NPDC003247]|uniref:class I mannose-6-phosphate isomerase n=1 Tax=Streptomyces sp. NPDC003247 TaxID=3364677 RepID=UPI003689FEDA